MLKKLNILTRINIKQFVDQISNKARKIQNKEGVYHMRFIKID